MFGTTTRNLSQFCPDGQQPGSNRHSARCARSMMSLQGFISNEAGRVKCFFLSFFLSGPLFLYSGHTHPFALEALFYWTNNSRPSSVSDPCPPYSLSPWSLHHFGVAHQSSLRSLWIMMCLCELPLLQGGGVA